MNAKGGSRPSLTLRKGTGLCFKGKFVTRKKGGAIVDPYGREGQSVSVVEERKV